MFDEVDYTGDINRYIEERGLGPHALAVSREEFKARPVGKKNSIKSALMDRMMKSVLKKTVGYQADPHKGS
ncbi:MAG: hypothetical protein ACREQW_12305 [Candidatus Binatia bacterium]